jgi:hypothetical protein
LSGRKIVVGPVHKRMEPGVGADSR